MAETRVAKRPRQCDRSVRRRRSPRCGRLRGGEAGRSGTERSERGGCTVARSARRPTQADKIEGTLASLIAPAIDLVAKLLNIGNIADKVQSVIEGVREMIDGAIDSVFETLKSALGIGGKEEEKPTEGEFDGQIGEEIAFSAGGEGHKLWVDASGQVIVASTPTSVERRLSISWTRPLLRRGRCPGRLRGPALRASQRAPRPSPSSGCGRRRLRGVATESSSPGLTALPCRRTFQFWQPNRVEPAQTTSFASKRAITGNRIELTALNRGMLPRAKVGWSTPKPITNVDQVCRTRTHGRSRSRRRLLLQTAPVAASMVP